MNPSNFQNIVDIIERTLLAGSQAIAPANPLIAADIQLGVLLFSIVGQLFHHAKSNPVPFAAAAVPVTVPNHTPAA